MKKTLYLLVLVVLAGCSSNKNETDWDAENFGKIIQQPNAMLGKWKVTYSKVITNAQYNPTTGKVETNIGNPSVTTEWKSGDSGMPETVFVDNHEYMMMIKEEVKIYDKGLKGESNKYYTFDNFREKAFYYNRGGNSTPKLYTVRYSFEGNQLVLELVSDPYAKSSRYAITKYSKTSW